MTKWAITKKSQNLTQQGLDVEENYSGSGTLNEQSLGMTETWDS